MKKGYRHPFILMLTAIVLASTAGSFMFRRNPIEQYTTADSFARISPDYSSTTIPPNIAPLNFRILENGLQYYVDIYSQNGEHIKISSRSGNIKIPIKRWKKLLNGNRGENLLFDIYIKDSEDGWARFKTISNRIVAEEIDKYVTYRLMGPIYSSFLNMDIYQRDLESFNKELILDSESFEDGCVNCHSYRNFSGDEFLLGTRSSTFGSSTLYVNNNQTHKIGTKFGHTSWHPSGLVAAYSAYRVKQFVHFKRPEVRDVVELDSAILYYHFGSRKAKPVPGLADKDQLETHPSWGPEGKYLYYSNAPILWSDRYEMPPENYEKLQYSLMRIEYDVKTDTWSEPERILSCEQTGLSLLTPRVSPDGRYILFAACKYSCFALYQSDSDLYLMDIKTKEYKKLDEICSDQAESWHSWSSNGRWIVYSSKRPEGVFTHLYLSYIDKDGNAYKPIIMPQKDPEFYDYFTEIFNVPEFTTSPVKIGRRSLSRYVRSPDTIKVDIPITGATAKAEDREAWLERE